MVHILRCLYTDIDTDKDIDTDWLATRPPKKKLALEITIPRSWKPTNHAILAELPEQRRSTPV